MFQENVEEINREQVAQSIPTGDYEVDVVGVSEMKAKDATKFGSWIVKLSVVGGEFDGCQYDYWVTWSPKAAGIRAKFYRAIGFVVPGDGNIDHNDFIGRPGLMTITNAAGNLRVTNLQRSARTEDDAAGGEGDNGFNDDSPL